MWSQAYPLRLDDGTDLLPEGTLDTDSGRGRRIAALGGVGMAQLLRLAVADELAAGRRAEIFPHDPLASVPVQALHAFGRLAPLRVRLFTDFLADRLAAHSA